MKKKAAALLLSVALCLLCACGGTPAEKKSLYDHGMDVVAIMHEMVSSDLYGEFMGESEDMRDVVSDLQTGDYTRPKAVYQISPPANMLGELADLSGVPASALEGLSEPLRDNLNKRLLSTVASQLNSRVGSTVLTMASMYTAGMAFVSPEVEENLAYLYTFADGKPVLVSFSAEEDGAVTASGSFLLDDALDIASVADLEALLTSVSFQGCTVEEVEIPDAAAE